MTELTLVWKGIWNLVLLQHQNSMRVQRVFEKLQAAETLGTSTFILRLHTVLSGLLHSTCYEVLVASSVLKHASFILVTLIVGLFVIETEATLHSYFVYNSVSIDLGRQKGEHV